MLNITLPAHMQAPEGRMFEYTRQLIRAVKSESPWQNHVYAMGSAIQAILTYCTDHPFDAPPAGLLDDLYHTRRCVADGKPDTVDSRDVILSHRWFAITFNEVYDREKGRTIKPISFKASRMVRCVTSLIARHFLTVREFSQTECEGTDLSWYMF